MRICTESQTKTILTSKYEVNEITSESSFNNGSFSGTTRAAQKGFRSQAYRAIAPAETIVCFSSPVLNVIPLVLINPAKIAGTGQQLVIKINLQRCYVPRKSLIHS